MKTNLIKALLTLSLIFASACSSGGGGDDSGSGVESGAQFAGACSLRITNGDTCDTGNGPIVFLIMADAQGNGISTCTGTLLTPTDILTAAHCLSSDVAFVLAKVSDQEQITSDFTPHPLFNDVNGEISPYDVGIVKVPTPFPNVTVMPLLVSEGISSGTRINISGYGKTQNGNSVATGEISYENGLKKGEMIVSEVGAAEGVFIAEFDSTKESVCSGDSGGSAIVLNRDNLPGIVGIAQAVTAEPGEDEPACLAGSIAVFTWAQSGAALSFITSLVPNAGLI